MGFLVRIGRAWWAWKGRCSKCGDAIDCTHCASERYIDQLCHACRFG
jgi:hypothetical protein